MAKTELKGAMGARYNEILTPEALAFLADLHTRFNATRLALLQARADRQKKFDIFENS